MAIQLVIADQTYDVERLTDTAADWQGVKVMLTQPDVDLKVATGAEVVLQGEEDLAGSYRVAQALSPAAPRSWRLFLEKATNLGAAPAPTTTAAAEPKQARTDVPNADKIFVIKVSGLVGVGVTSNVRKSTVEYKVPFSRLTQEMARITKTGVTILSVKEADLLGSL
ncbi:MAG: phycobilisome linker polypeptide [Cyanophyceae cyanobacterium]